MNNFQLNNTSVYLGGQCQWDLILKSQNNKFVVDGFQLSPISNNVSFNKKGEVKHLNNNHSDTLKKFASELKENFWSIKSTENIYKYNDSDHISYDPSFNAGVKRLPSFEVYERQYGYFIPLWLEYIPNSNSYLKFRLSAFTKDGNTPLGYEDFELKILDDNDFHNQFVNYFNNWLTYLNIIPNESRYHEEDDENKGNDRVLNIDMKNLTTTISGVSVNSGQLINEINCDYTSYNLLNFERPNIETDYILSSLFKSHNIIAPQLFNFNLCFDLDDIISPVFMNQLYGQQIKVTCDVTLVINENGTESNEVLEKRSIFTNYEFIQKSSYNPFIFLSDTDGDGMENYVIAPKGSVIKENVLDYLRDYNNIDIKNKNKLTQPICHWGPVSHEGESFNLYDGYKYNYFEFGVDVKRSSDTSGITYEYDNYEIPYSNGVSISYLGNKYVGGQGELTWLYPSRAIYAGYEGYPVGSVSFDIIMKLMYKGEGGLIYKNLINISKCNKQWGTNVSVTGTPTIDGITCVYMCVGDTYNVYQSIINLYENGVYQLSNSKGDDISGDVAIVIDSGVAVIYTKNMDYLMLNGILDMRCDIPSNNKMEEILDIAKGIKESIIQGNSGEFYGFGTEIGVGKNDLNQEVYYKLDSKSTHVFRKDGKLSPMMIVDDGKKINYDYYLSVNDQEIKKFEDGGRITSPEICTYKTSYVLDLLSELSFTVSKLLNDNSKSLKDLIKEQLKIVYKTNDSELIDYIYNLYRNEFDYDYVFEENPSIIYEVKLILI